MAGTERQLRFSEDFIAKIFRLFRDEEEDLYVLNLHFLNSDDLDFFSQEDLPRVKHIFEELIYDTKRHTNLLRLIYDLIEES